jgi:hypothetical protein
MIKKLLGVFYLCIVLCRYWVNDKEEEGFVFWCIFFLCWLLYCIRAEQKKKNKEEPPAPRANSHELQDFHKVSFCTICVKQMTRHLEHCDGCGGHDRANIKQHIVKDGETDYICTNCFHLARYPNHCDLCGGRTTIVEIK